MFLIVRSDIVPAAVHSSIVLSQRYIHSTPEGVKLAFEAAALAQARMEIEPKQQLPLPHPLHSY